MKIVLISPFYSPSRGGVETIVQQTAEELAKRDNTVSVLTTNYSNSWSRICEQSITKENGVTIYRIQPHPVRVGFAALMNGIEEILKKEKPDIVHSHNLHPHLFQAMRCKNSLQFKLFAQLHYPAATGIDGIGAKLAYPVILDFLRIRQQKIDGFVVHTELEKKWLINKGIDEKHINKLHYPCADLTFLKKKCTIDENKTSSKSLEFDILYVGRCDRKERSSHSFRGIVLSN